MAREVLVPLDNSEPAQSALEYALEHHRDDSISMIHVIEAMPVTPYQARSLTNLQEEHAEALMSEAREITEDYDTRVEMEHVWGDPVEEITDYVDEHDTDLVIIGSHGRGGVRRFFLGSVAEQVLRRLQIPVTVVSAEED